MARLSRSLLALAFLVCAVSAHADGVRLVAPANGVTLRGGSFAELRWTAAQAPPAAEEWEAFLSVDGGKYYAFRVTPHLDIALRRFTFVVPNVATRHARILIRTGNEVQELHFESHGTFAIERDPNAEQVVRRLRFGHGEAAREGDPAVLSWADGARNGSGVTQQSSPAAQPDSFRPLAKDTSHASGLLVPAANRAAAPSLAVSEQPVRAHDARKAESLPLSADLLLVCRRRNI